MSSFWIVELSLNTELRVSGGETQVWTREEFFEWAWVELHGLQGVHEGTILSEEASKIGLETESWLVDSGEAPRHRDWIGSQDCESPQLYFSSQEQALEAAALLRAFEGCSILRVFEQPVQDWDAEWKRSFQGVDLPPDWRVLPPWCVEGLPVPGRHVVILNPGAGFGTGTHETTQLCLQAFAEGLEKGCSVSSVLDFGSGSGILAIGAAIRGARVVHAVEIDPLAVDNARENARLNGASERVTWASDLSGLNELRPTDGYSVVFANILRPVLLEFVDQLTARISAQGMLILSGLIESDLDLVIQAYSARLAGFHLRVLSKNEWRALVFERNLWLCAVRERVK